MLETSPKNVALDLIVMVNSHGKIEMNTKPRSLQVHDVRANGVWQTLRMEHDPKRYSRRSFLFRVAYDQRLKHRSCLGFNLSASVPSKRYYCIIERHTQESVTEGCNAKLSAVYKQTIDSAS